MLIVCDFDGTVTARDTNSELARCFAPEQFERVEGRLASRELTLREVLDAELGAVIASFDAVLDVALAIPFRPGFERLVSELRSCGDELVLLSSGFRQLIEPMLARERLDGLVPLLANDVEFTPAGGRITWRDLPCCERCGEQCKRHDVERLRSGALHDGRRFDRVVYVGDGYSDRCGAEAADVVFALRDGSLAGYLTRLGVPHEVFDDLHDVVERLATLRGRT